jgi:predicted metalloprotease
MAIGSLVCSLLGISLIGLILGIVAKNQINASGGRQGGAGLALAGIIIGIIGMVFYLLVPAVLFPVFQKAREQARQQNGYYNGTRTNKLNTTPTRIDYSDAIRTAANWSVTMNKQA